MIDGDGVSVGVDIGTSKTSVVIAQRDEFEEKITILGSGIARNSGVRKGKIVNIEATIASIKKAAEDAILMAGVEIGTVNINVPGEIESLNSNGIVGISRKDKEVSYKDIQRVIDTAKQHNIGHDKVILHIFPQNFKLDEQDNIKDPVGMTGLRLEGSVHLITAPRINLTNIIKCVKKAGFNPVQGISSAFASANAVLSDEDRHSGALVVDIGAGTTDIIGFLDGHPVFSTVVLLGGNNLTKDLSIGLKIAEGLSEKIKIKHGCVYSGLVDPVEEIEIPLYGRNQVERISKQRINTVLEPRAEEIFLMVKRRVEEKGYNLDYFSNGVVLTGGGSKLTGMLELGEKILGVPARMGYPQNIGGIIDEVMDPAYSAAVGICVGEKSVFEDTLVSEEKKHLLNGNTGQMGQKLKSFFKEIFG